MAEAPFVITDQPHHVVDADQWGESGYVYYQGRVHFYRIDRKDPGDELVGEWLPAAFLDDSTVPEAARAWLRALI